MLFIFPNGLWVTKSVISFCFANIFGSLPAVSIAVHEFPGMNFQEKGVLWSVIENERSTGNAFLGIEMIQS